MQEALEAVADDVLEDRRKRAPVASGQLRVDQAEAMSDGDLDTLLGASRNVPVMSVTAALRETGPAQRRLEGELMRLSRSKVSGGRHRYEVRVVADAWSAIPAAVGSSETQGFVAGSSGSGVGLL